MAWQIFGTLAAGNQPLSLFDTLSGQIAQTVIIPTTATGTNAIALALNANAPTITAYNNYQQFSFVAANSSTGAVTVNVASIGALNLYKPGNIAAGSGDITAGVLYVISFNQALNAGAGGFVIVSATPSTLSLPVTVANGGTGVTSFGTTFGVICAGTAVAGNLQVIASVGTGGQVLTSNGAGALPTFQAVGVTSGNLVSIVTYGSSQTITIPANATKAAIRLMGGGGGMGNLGGVFSAGGGGAYLEKYLTGLTSGNTLALTIGAAGSAGNPGSAGGNTVLASGSQSITTLTAGGGGVGGNNTSGAGGTATNGDINSSGNAVTMVTGGCITSVFLSNGCGPFGAGFGQGGFNPANGTSSPAATAGVAKIEWYS